MIRSGEKLTLVSVYYKGRTIAVFIPLKYRRNAYGKLVAVVDNKTLNKMLNDIGCTDRGVTYSIG